MDRIMECLWENSMTVEASANTLQGWGKLVIRRVYTWSIKNDTTGPYIACTQRCGGRCVEIREVPLYHHHKQNACFLFCFHTPAAHTPWLTNHLCPRVKILPFFPLRSLPTGPLRVSTVSVHSQITTLFYSLKFIPGLHYCGVPLYIGKTSLYLECLLGLTNF